jgi:methyl-accepting chemotaxis protein
MNSLNNLATRTTLLAGFLIVALIVGTVGFVGWNGMGHLMANQDSLYAQHLVPMQPLSSAKAAAFELQGNLGNYVLLPDERAAIEADIATNLRTLKTVVAQFSV